MWPGNPSKSDVANIIDLDNKSENKKTKATRVPIILQKQISSVASKPNGTKQV